MKACRWIAFALLLLLHATVLLAAPNISGLSPASGPVGTSVIISGSNFGDSGTVTFNGQTATTSGWSSNSITAVVPSGASTGEVVVTVGGAPSNGVVFTVEVMAPVYSGGVSVAISPGTPGTTAIPDVLSLQVSVQLGSASLPVFGQDVSVGVAPAIGSLSQGNNPVGAAVTITGVNFGGIQSVNSQVSINGAAATSTSWSVGSITATVPSGAATTGNVVVTVNGMNSNGLAFTVVPGINGLNPAAGDPGVPVTITGTNFGSSQGSGGVQFNGTAATVTNWSDTGITAYVPVGATSGNVVVTSAASLQSGGAAFTVTDNFAVTQLSPALGPVGTLVTITGGGFGNLPGPSAGGGTAPPTPNAVNFDGIAATINSWSDTQITAIVPVGASTGPVTITNVAGITITAPINFVLDSTVQLTDSLGNNTTYTAATFGGAWVTSSVQGSGCSSCSMRGNIQNSYDNNGNLIAHTDELGHVTTYTYDGSGNITSVSTQLNTTTTVTTSYTYNNFGEVLTMTDPLGNVTTNAYDANGNLLSVTAPAPNGNTAASVTQFAYNALGELTQITDPLGHASTLAYTPVGLIASITDAQQNVTSYQYDSHGNRTAIVDAQQNVTSFAYDSMDRLITITYPDKTTAGFGYDSRGRRTTVTDQDGHATSYSYDDADRLLSVTDAASHVTQYAYDTENNLLSITDANSNVTSFAYDAFGRVTQTAFPSGLAESYSYDAAGNLASKVDRKGQAILYVYDALNRLTYKEYPDSTAVDYVYDLAGKIKQVTDPTGSYGFAYDNMGRLVGTTTQYAFLPSVTYTNAYGYDANSNRTSFAAPDGSTNTYQYDALNRLTTLTSSLTGQFTFAYDSLSRRTALNRPNGVSTSYSYDSLSHLLSVLHQTGTSTLDSESYTYDSVGNRTSKANQLNNATEQYAYDAIYQLQQVNAAAQNGGTTTTESYTYDAVGNRLSSLTVPQWNYNTSNELTSNSAATFAYDKNGNTTSKTVSSGATQYTWDFENRLGSAVMLGTGGTVTFKYDPFGRRIQKAFTQGATTATTNYLYDGANDVAEVDQNGNVVARYTQGAGIDEPLAEYRSSTASFYEQDGLGSVTSLSTSTGSLANTYVYKAFGNLASSSGSTVNPFQYTGRDYDPETGLRYYRARYFDSSIGRFFSEDPIGWSGGINFYRYANDNPVTFRDPTGTTTYECTAPLHALGKVGGKIAYYTLPFVGIPTYHAYLCVKIGKQMICGGQDRSGPALGGPGQPSQDTAGERGGGCVVVNTGDCIDQCVKKAIQDPNRPNYDLLNRKNKGVNCQKWVDDTMAGCIQSCTKK